MSMGLEMTSTELSMLFTVFVCVDVMLELSVLTRH